MPSKKPTYKKPREVIEYYETRWKTGWNNDIRVIKREFGKVVLESISKRYTFEMFEGTDDHWEIIK